MCLWGKADHKYNTLSLISPKFHKGLEEERGILPIYPLGEGLTQTILRQDDAAGFGTGGQTGVYAAGDQESLRTLRI